MGLSTHVQLPDPLPEGSFVAVEAPPRGTLIFTHVLRVPCVDGVLRAYPTVYFRAAAPWERATHYAKVANAVGTYGFVRMVYTEAGLPVMPYRMDPVTHTYVFDVPLTPKPDAVLRVKRTS